MQLNNSRPMSHLQCKVFGVVRPKPLLLLLLLLVLCDSGRAQLPSAPFQQSPFQQRQQGVLQQQTPFQRQRQQPIAGQGLFPSQGSALNPLAALAPPITPLQAGVQSPYNRYNQYQQNYVPITAYQNDLNLDGSFSYGYAAADGTTAQAQGYVKNLGYGEGVEAQVSVLQLVARKIKAIPKKCCLLLCCRAKCLPVAVELQ